MSIINSWTLLQLMSIELVMPSNHLIIFHPLLLQPSIFPITRVFSNESVLRIRWPKYWSFTFNISPSNEYLGLISLKMDWLDVLAVQGTLKSLLQHHSSKASILQHLTYFIVQLSHPYMTTGKPVTLTRWTFISKVVSVSYFFIFKFIYFNRRLVTLQYYSGFCHTDMNQSWIYLCSPSGTLLQPPSPSHSSGSAI